MYLKLLQAILLLFLFTGKSESQTTCPSPQVPDTNGVCICANQAGTSCGTLRTFNTQSCGCECTNKASVAPTCNTENQVFDEINCKCDCANRASTTCVAPLVYKDEFCTCACPNPPITDCQCVGVTYDYAKCDCIKPTKSCADITYNCATGQFDYPPNPNPDQECSVYDETKCKWEVPSCPAGQEFRTVYDDANVKTCGCVTPVEDCQIYYINPDFTAGKSTVKYICKSCSFNNVLNDKGTRCYVCQDWKIRVYDSANRLLGNVVYVGDPRKKKSYRGRCPNSSRSITSNSH